LTKIRFDGRVAIVTGGGQGLGRSHALGFASRGARVVVNDLGGARDGTGSSLSPAEAVVAEIEEAGGEAYANGADVSDRAAVDAMVAEAVERWGAVDILVNNAGILRDKSFQKVDLADFEAVLAVHLMGSVHCTQAVWAGMRDRSYGRIVMTTSASGLYGNFGQSNYGAAKAAVVGLMNTLADEGAKYEIRVNAIAPTAATRMTEDLLPPNLLGLLAPEAVTPAVLFLGSEDAPTGSILAAGAGVYARATVVESPGTFLAADSRTPEAVAKLWARESASEERVMSANAGEQTRRYLERAAAEMSSEPQDSGGSDAD